MYSCVGKNSPRVGVATRLRRVTHAPGYLVGGGGDCFVTTLLAMTDVMGGGEACLAPTRAASARAILLEVMTGWRRKVLIIIMVGGRESGR